jgi:uncharacterized membrane protein YtjA (UPF0391 family)
VPARRHRHKRFPENAHKHVTVGTVVTQPGYLSPSILGSSHHMLRLALFFLVVSIIAAIFGFGGIAAASASIARILFFIAIVIFVVLLVAGLMAGSTLF